MWRRGTRHRGSMADAARRVHAGGPSYGEFVLVDPYRNYVAAVDRLNLMAEEVVRE